MENNNYYEAQVAAASVDAVLEQSEKAAGSKFLNTSVRSIEIEQEVGRGFTPEKAREFVDGWAPVDKYVGCLHDRDFKEDCKTPRAPHVHLMVKFRSPLPVKNILARAVRIGLGDCIRLEQLEKVKNWSGAVNYLTHRDEQLPHKHVYDVDELFHSDGFDFEIEAQAAHGRKEMKVTPAREKEIIDSIVAGDIMEYNINNYVSAYERITLSRKIDIAFKIRSEKMEKEERCMEVMFVYGGSGVGKDSFAVEFAKQRYGDYFRCNNNQAFPFDDYRGEPVIIWSDARDDVFKPTELFNLLDNHFNSKQKARFHDRCLNCKLMIITSIKPLNEWYKAAFDAASEPRKQLYRRIRTNVVIDDKHVNFYIYNDDLVQYEYAAFLPNIYQHEENIINTPEKRKAFMVDLLGGMSQAISYATDKVEKAPVEEFQRLNVDDNLPGQMRFDNCEWIKNEIKSGYPVTDAQRRLIEDCDFELPFPDVDKKEGE